jgi:hypothetical protein
MDRLRKLNQLIARREHLRASLDCLRASHEPDAVLETVHEELEQLDEQISNALREEPAQ